jgi:transcription initiation factor TFIIB
MKSAWDLFDSEFLKQEVEPIVRDKCSVCDSIIKLTEDGFLTCTNKACSVVHLSAIDLSAEWRFYGGDDTFSGNPIRCGMPINPLLPESSIGCKINCSGKASFTMRKIARYTEWHSMPYKEKARYEDFQRIITLSNNANIPKMIIDEACKHYKQISEKQSFRGLNRDGIIAASVYIAFKIQNFPRTAKEIACIFHLDTTSATRGCKNAMTIINELEKSTPMDQTIYAATSPHSFIDRFCSALSMNAELTKLADFIAIQIEKKNMIPENTPQSVAAGIMFFLSREFNLNITEQDIELISHTSGVTINKCCRKMETIKHQLIPSSIYAKYKVEK